MSVSHNKCTVLRNKHCWRPTKGKKKPYSCPALPPAQETSTSTISRPRIVRCDPPSILNRPIWKTQETNVSFSHCATHDQFRNRFAAASQCQYPLPFQKCVCKDSPVLSCCAHPSLVTWRHCLALCVQLFLKPRLSAANSMALLAKIFPSSFSPS